MLLKNLMEEKQLDFNQPLLSVRRFEVESRRKTNSNAAPRMMPPLPVYKSELKSGPVRNPGTVPFVWEQTPGRPKDQSKPQPPASQVPPVAPKLPPGRVLNNKLEASEKGCKSSTASTRSRGNSLSDPQNVAKEESSKGRKDETASCGSEGHEAYLDALDTLSRSESFFLNSSISGVSGLDGPDLKPSGTFSTDPHTRDFMMGRFLPAAKAMASETPQCSTRKQPVAREQPKQMKNVAIVEQQLRVSQYRSTNIPHYARSNGVEDGEEGDDYEGPDNSSLKVCGLLPRLCLQNSFCLLNPVPGMRKPAQPSMSSICPKDDKSSYATSCSTENECNRNSVNEQKLMDGLQSTGMHESKYGLNHESNQNTCKTEGQKLDGQSLCERLQGNGSLPDDNHFSQSAAHVKRGFPRIVESTKSSEVAQCAKGGRYFRELLANERNEWESKYESPAAEKTLYIDSVHTVKPQNSNSSFRDMNAITDYKRDDVEILAKNRGIEETSSVDSSLQDTKHLSDVSEKVGLQLKSLESVDSQFLSPSKKSTHNVINGSRLDEELAVTSPKVDRDWKIYLESQPNWKSGNLESLHGFIQDSITLTSGKLSDSQIDLERQPCTKLSNQETSKDCYPPLPRPPPLPKSPSESWLKRTLPTLPSRASLGMRVYPGFQASKTQSFDPKWETIVRTTNVQHGQLQFPEESLMPIPEA